MQANFFANQSPSNIKASLIHYNDEYKTAFLFEAIAKHLIESVKFLPVHLINKWQNILNGHAKYFPKQLPAHITALSTHEQFSYLLTYIQPIDELLLPSLAHTLQQLTVDIISQYPEIYGNLLLKGFDLHALRQIDNLDDPSILQALSDKTLMSNIYVERYHNTYQLPVKEYYPSSDANAHNLYIHYQDKLYKSNLINGAKSL